MKITILQSILIACFLGTVVHAGIFGPVNYDECVTASMKGVTSDYAAQKIDEACLKRFPGGKRQGRSLRSLSSSEVALLTGRGGAVAQNTNYFVGSIYNGNREGTVRALTIYLMPRVPAESFQGMVKEMDVIEADRRRTWKSAPVMMPFDDVERKKRETEGRLRYYHVDIDVPPLTTRNFSVQVLESDVSPEGYEWGIAGADVD